MRNAASLLPGPVAPGEIVILSGAGIDSHVSVLFDGVPAPLLNSSLNQVSLVVPYRLYGKTSVVVRVTQGGQPVSEFPLAVAEASPAIFSMDGTATGPGAILNQDSTVNSASNPAGRESIVSVFTTGAGQTDPPGVDGQTAADVLPKPLLPVSVRIGGLDAEVLDAVATPGLVAGVLQVDCRVPANSPSGSQVPIVLTVGKTDSPPGVTLAVAASSAEYVPAPAVSLHGFGVRTERVVTRHSASLSWTASVSPNVTGYNAYRGTASGGPYTKLTSSPVIPTSYTDSTVQSGKTYYYVTTAVDSNNLESAYSNEAKAIIPSP